MVMIQAFNVKVVQAYVLLAKKHLIIALVVLQHLNYIIINAFRLALNNIILMLLIKVARLAI